MNSSETRDNMKLIFKCQCGAVQADLQGAPSDDRTCHCHSCVAAAKFVEAKPDFKGISALTNTGGVTFTLYKGSKINFTTDVTSDEAREKIFGYVKVGSDGKQHRTYCRNCGTMLGWLRPGFVGLNRNCITLEDGTAYEPPGTVLNIMKKHAFDPSTVRT